MLVCVHHGKQNTGQSVGAAGYMSTIGVTTDIFKLLFDTETVSLVAAQLSLGRSSGAGVNSLLRGYFCGGYQSATPHNVNRIDGIQFDTEAALLPACTLSVPRYSAYGLNSDVRGYFCEGYSTTTVNEIDGMIFSTETAINPAATMYTNCHAADGVSSAATGYGGGGYGYNDPATLSTGIIRGFRFATEASFLPSSSLSLARYAISSFNSDIKGYWAGGTSTGWYSRYVDSMRFDTEVQASLGAALQVARAKAGGSNSDTKGYQTGGCSVVSQADILSFSTETTGLTSASLSYTSGGSAGVQSGGYL